MSEKYFVRTVTEYEVTVDIDSISLTDEGEKQITTQALTIITNTDNPEKIKREIMKKYKLNNTGKSVFITCIIKRLTQYKIKESDFFEYAKAEGLSEQVVYLARGGLENEWFN